MTSILRTYYSWKIYKSIDISYNMIIMGFWTWAEIAIGVTVSCLPVIPRFFQHFGPGIRSSLLSKYRSGFKKSWSRSLSGGSSMRDKTSTRIPTAIPKRVGGMGTSDSWEYSSNGTLHAAGNYIALGDYERPPEIPSKAFVSGGSSGSREDGFATMRNDIEMAHGFIF